MTSRQERDAGARSGSTPEPAAPPRAGAAREDEDVYRRLVENTPEVIARFDRALRHTYVNAYGAKVYGLPVQEIVGKTHAELGMPADKVAFWTRQFEAVFATGEQRTVDFEFDSPTFGRQSLSSLFVPERGEAGEVVSVVAITRDVSAAKRAEEALRASEARFRAFVTASSDVVYRVSPDWREMRQLHGREFIPDTDAPSTSWMDRYIHPDDQPRVWAAIQEAIRKKCVYELEHRVLRVDGTLGWLFSRAVPLLDGRGEIVEWFGTATDVTERKRAEQELTEANARLRDADRRKDEFLGMLSHELRNPLAPIRNAIYLLHHAAPGSAQAGRAQGVVERQVEHLTRIVDDLLDVTRIARGKIALRRARTDLREVVSRAAEDFRLLFRDRAVSFRVALPDAAAWGDADPTRITQIVGNLLHNASKFTRGGDEVALSLEARDGLAILRVRDTGAGIDAALLPTIFDPFVQGERTLARTEGGLGLGLSLVKGIAELHGGSVAVESAGDGAGATFTVTLPLSTADAEPRRAAAPAPAPRGGVRHVLVVDDNVDAAESLAEVAAFLGHSVEVAFDGPSALEKARVHPPDVVLCDLGLPGMSGYEVARTLRARGGAMKLYAVSGYAQPDDVRAALEAGFDGHVAKPADPECIERLLAS